MSKSSWLEYIPDWYLEAILFIIVAGVFIGLPVALVLSSATAPSVEDGKPDRHGDDITVRTIDRHEYIIYVGYKAGGICHKEDCKFCNNKLKGMKDDTDL